MKTEVHYPDEFDEALSETTRPGEEIHLRSGVGYVTQGNWLAQTRPWANLAAGVALIGNGATVSLRNPFTAPEGIQRANRDVNLLWGAGDNTIRDLTMDGSQAGANLHVGGIRILGPADISNVEVRGLRGTWNGVGTLHKEIEVFGLVVLGGATPSKVNNFRIANCAPNAYVSGVFLVNNAEGSVLNIDLGARNWFGISAGERVKFYNVSVTGARVVLYNDTGPTDRVSVSNLFAVGAETLLSMVSVDGTRKGHIAIRDSEVELVGDAAGEARIVELVDKTPTMNAPLGHVLLSDVTVTSVAKRIHAAPFLGLGVQPVVFDNCKLPANLQSTAKAVINNA
jgi:hypothetical protein